jgi:hypothetical protein
MITEKNRQFVIRSYVYGTLEVNDVLEFVDNPTLWGQTLNDEIRRCASHPEKCKKLAVLYNFMPTAVETLPTQPEDLIAL